MGFSDGGTIVLGWLARVTVILGILGVVTFDALSLAVTRLSVMDDAESGAIAAVHAYQESGSADRAYESALSAVRTRNPHDVIEPGTFSVSRDGQVNLTVARETVTIAARYIPAVKNRLTMRAQGDAKP